MITYLTFALPLATWVMVTYLDRIPRTLEEAGLIDGQLMGASVVSAVPVVVLYLIFQRHLVSGLTSGGVKS